MTITLSRSCLAGMCLLLSGLPFAHAADTRLFAGQSGTLDIAETIRAALIFYEPMQPLCGEDCKGLCFHCGADRNQKECQCEQKVIDPRLAGLGRLLE